MGVSMGVCMDGWVLITFSCCLWCSDPQKLCLHLISLGAAGPITSVVPVSLQKKKEMTSKRMTINE